VLPSQSLLPENEKLKQEKKKMPSARLKALSRISYIGSATCLLMTATAVFAFM
jgi:hypothetical protein